MFRGSFDIKKSKKYTDSLNSLNLESKRLTLKKFGQSEVKFNIEDEMNSLIMKYIKDVESFEATKIKTEKLVKPWTAKEGEWFAGALRLKDDNCYVGLVCFRYQSIKDQVVEIGWRLREDYYGYGYATEAASLLAEYLRDNLKINKLMAYCDNDNIASIKVMSKLGMKREGLLVKHFRINGVWRDEGIFALSFVE